MVEELPHERGARGVLRVVRVVEAEVRIRDQGHRPSGQVVGRVEDPARLADVAQRCPDAVVGRVGRPQVREYAAEYRRAGEGELASRRWREEEPEGAAGRQGAGSLLPPSR
jgi:hypothetical protein